MKWVSTQGLLCAGGWECAVTETGLCGTCPVTCISSVGWRVTLCHALNSLKGSSVGLISQHTAAQQLHCIAHRMQTCAPGTAALAIQVCVFTLLLPGSQFQLRCLLVMALFPWRYSELSLQSISLWCVCSTLGLGYKNVSCTPKELMFLWALEGDGASGHSKN